MNSDGQDAKAYGRAAEPLPDLHVFSRLSELDEAYAEELARARARQETIERDVAALAKRLMAPLEGASSVTSSDKRRGWFGRATSSSRGA
jgi:hypothetical protein